MNILELKADEKYSFGCELSAEFSSYDNWDEWGCACVWFGDEIGAEYNFCIDNGHNCSAIYKMTMNKDEDIAETDYSTFVHYEVDFSKENWKDELEDAMCRALIDFYISFLDDEEKMADFDILTKEEFLASYSYLTEEEYDATKRLR